MKNKYIYLKSHMRIRSAIHKAGLLCDTEFAATVERTAGSVILSAQPER